MSVIINGSGTVNGVTTQDGVVINGPAFHVYQTVAQSVTTTDTLLSFDTVDFDTNSAYDTVNKRFKPLVAGYYHLDGNVQISGTTSQVYVVLYKNGAIYKYGMNLSVSSSTPIVPLGGCMVYLNGTTDYVDLRAFSGTTLNTNPGISRVSFAGFLARLP
jgi:hypothetical protein